MWVKDKYKRKPSLKYNTITQKKSWKKEQLIFVFWWLDEWSDGKKEEKC